MPTTPNHDIYYPDSQTNLTPLEAHFAALAASVEAALEPRILTSEDLDDVTGSGTYIQRGNAGATLARNYPASHAGLLTVTSDGLQFVFQTYQTYQNPGKLWIRSWYMGNWRAWAEK